jgi:integrase
LSKEQSGVGDQKRQKTIGEYTKSQNLFLELYGDIDLSEIDSSTALGVIEHLEKTGAANGTIVKHLSGIRAAIDRAVELKWIPQNPMQGVKTAKRGKAAVKTDNWNTADFNRLFAQDIKQQELMLFQLLSATGFRLEEGAAIEWADIKLSIEGVNYFDLHALNKVLKTENAMRNVPIHHQLMSLLNAYGGAVGRDGRLFKYRKDKKDGKCVKNATKALTPYLKVARYENGTKVKHLKTHGLRGTFTSACYKVGMPDSMRRFLIGQKQQGEDTAYLEADLDRENEMLQKIDFTHIT